MRALKVIVFIIGILAAYKAFQVLVLGKPLDPGTALAEWARAAGSERPQGLGPGTTLARVQYRWEESNSIWFGDGLKDWTETYELRADPGEQMKGGEKERIRMYICGNRLRQKVLDLDIPINVRLVGPGKYDDQQFVLTKSACTAARL